MLGCVLHHSTLHKTECTVTMFGFNFASSADTVLYWMSSFMALYLCYLSFSSLPLSLSLPSLYNLNTLSTRWSSTVQCTVRSSHCTVVDAM